MTRREWPTGPSDAPSVGTGQRRDAGRPPARVATHRTLSPTVGICIRGADLRAPTAALVARVAELLAEHLVVVFEEQFLDSRQHLDLARYFGDPVLHPYFDRAEHVPEVVVMDNTRSMAANWHSDMSYLSEPPVLSIGRMVVCPPAGGVTRWSNQLRAYADLDRETQRRVSSLAAIHATEAGDRAAIHSIVALHPPSGALGLFVSRHFTKRILGVEPTESDRLLAILFDQSERLEYQCYHLWKAGDVAFWDNRSVIHAGVDDYVGRRRMERVSVR